MAMEGDAADTDSLGEFVRELSAELRWDPATDATGAAKGSAKGAATGEAKRAFVEALTEIAALPLDSISMEVRRLLVTAPAAEGGGEAQSEQAAAPTHLRYIVAALESRDVLLKCKAASAVGSLCVSRVAGQRLLDVVGGRVLASLGRMARCRNQWAQADALFVLGWVAVIADEATLAAVSALVPAVLRALGRNLQLLLRQPPAPPTDRKTAALAASEPAANLRVYSLVLLLNLCQRDARVFATQVDALAEVLADVLRVLLACRRADEREGGRQTAVDASEFAELLRLAVSVLSLLVGTLAGMRERLLELKAVPVLLKLKKEVDGDVQTEAGAGAFIDPDETDDVAERLKALVGALLST